MYVNKSKLFVMYWQMNVYVCLKKDIENRMLC